MLIHLRKWILSKSGVLKPMSIFNLTSIKADMKRTPQILQIKVIMITLQLSTSSSLLRSSKTNPLGNEVDTR